MAQAASPQISRAVFWLRPMNDEAVAIVHHQRNSHLISRHRLVFSQPYELYLDIGRIPSTTNDGVTLATLGRQGDIYIDDEFVSRVQCAFEINRDSMVVMLYDRSHTKSTQVHGMNQNIPGHLVFQFENGRRRRMVCVSPSINPVLGMCGTHKNRILFQLVWPENAADVLALKASELATPANVAHLARTLDDTETAPETIHSTRIHTPALGNSMKIRYQKWEPLGQGSFGVVHRVLNVDTGHFMALKRLKRSPTIPKARWDRCKREVEILAKIHHPHIQDLIWSQRWDHDRAEIFLGLKDGALDKLVLGGSYAANNQTLQTLADHVFYHMLQALDALARQGIIHRDVKPENIFYVQRPGTYHFLLGDFGVSTENGNSTSVRVGTQIYMAPEMYSGKYPRTHKVDVWSLFVTMLWTLDVGGFRARCSSFKSHDDICNAVEELASHDDIQQIRRMAAFCPDERASAAQMLCTFYKGKGLSTPRNEVPPLLP